MDHMTSLVLVLSGLFVGLPFGMLIERAKSKPTPKGGTPKGVPQLDLTAYAAGNRKRLPYPCERVRVPRLNCSQFTLVELLFVVGIVSAVFALLVPTVWAARSKAKSTQCMNNAKQLQQYSQLHVNDHDGRLPATYPTAESIGIPSGSFSALDYYDYRSVGSGRCRLFWGDALIQGYAVPSEVFECPASEYPAGTVKVNPARYAEGRVLGYAVNSYIDRLGPYRYSFNLLPSVGRRLSSIDRPAYSVYLLDNQAPSYARMRSNVMDAFTATRHGNPEKVSGGNGGSFAYFDGHVESVKVEGNFKPFSLDWRAYDPSGTPFDIK